MIPDTYTMFGVACIGRTGQIRVRLNGTQLYLSEAEAIRERDKLRAMRSMDSLELVVIPVEVANDRLNPRKSL